MRVRELNHAGSLSSGKSAPDKKNNGKIRKLVISWNPSGLSMRDPIISPMLTIEVVVTNRMASETRIENAVSRKPGMKPSFSRSRPSRSNMND